MRAGWTGSSGWTSPSTPCSACAAGPSSRSRARARWPRSCASRSTGLGVADRVELLGFVSADELIALYAGARAAYYAPLNEDYGYVTVESFLSRKPVVTTSDAGGVLEFVTATARRASSRSPTPRPSPTPSTRYGPAAVAPARDGRRRLRAGGGHHLGRRHRSPDGVDSMSIRLPIWPPHLPPLRGEGWGGVDD